MAPPPRPIGPIGAAIVALLCFFLIIGIAFLAFDLRPFASPSSAMAPALREGDWFLAAKHPFGFGRYSFPFGLLKFEGRYFPGTPAAGDIAVFVSPQDEATLQVFRVVGLPGDRVQIIAGRLHLNGAPVARQDTERPGDLEWASQHTKFHRETLPNGASYVTIDTTEDGYGDETQEVVVPNGHVFVLGDNRDNANDSRFTLGPVPMDRLIARAQFVYWNVYRISLSDRRDLRARPIQ
jgi:signal peptidase I